MSQMSLIPEGLTEELVAKLNKDPLGFLVGDSLNFLKNNWEKKPFHIKANADRKKFFSGICSFESLCKLGNDLAAEALKYEAKLQEMYEKEDEEESEDEEDEMEPPPRPLLLSQDINAVRYVDGMRENLLEGLDPASEDALVTIDSLTELYQKLEGTLQYHQPQRYDDRLWLLCSALEREIECLVGSNAYLTPKGSQGLAPHHDDVELWVCQTVGKKSWRVYKPFKGHELPTLSSPDLPEDEIGSPALEVTLEVGDVLYLPRGWVHQAVAQESDSAHVTVSTYQQFSYGEAASHLMYFAMRDSNKATCAPLELRKGVPLGFVSHCGYQARQEHPDSAKPHAKNLAEALRAMASKLEQNADIMHNVGDMMAMDFITSRLPPHPSQMPDHNGPVPTPDARFRSVGRSYARVVRVPQDDMPPGRPAGLVKVVSCLGNDRLSHMIETGDDEEGHEHEHEHDHEHDHHHHHHHHEEEDQKEEEQEEGEKPKKGAAKKKEVAKQEEEEEEEDDDDDAPEAIGLDDEDEDEDDDSLDLSDEEDEEDKELVYPEEFGPVLAKLLACEDERGVALSDLKIPESYFEGEKPTEDELEGIRMAIVTSLWEMGLIITLDRKEEKKEAGKKRKGEEGKEGSGKKQKK